MTDYEGVIDFSVPVADQDCLMRCRNFAQYSYMLMVAGAYCYSLGVNIDTS